MAFDSILEFTPMFPAGVPYSTEPSKAPKGRGLTEERRQRILAMVEEMDRVLEAHELERQRLEIERAKRSA